MAAPKGHKRYGGGRKKGQLGKNTAALKEMILQALDESGGVNYLKAQAKDNPTAFMTIVGKVLPLTVAGDKENPLSIGVLKWKDEA